MAWQFYIIIFVSFIWASHVFIQFCVNRINLMKEHFETFKTPLIFNEVYTNENKLKINYVNISEQKIVGFNMMIEIENKDGKIESVNHYVDKLTNPIKAYENKTFYIELTLLKESEKITKAYPVQVMLFDGSIWNIK